MRRLRPKELKTPSPRSSSRAGWSQSQSLITWPQTPIPTLEPAHIYKKIKRKKWAKGPRALDHAKSKWSIGTCEEDPVNKKLQICTQFGHKNAPEEAKRNPLII